MTKHFYEHNAQDEGNARLLGCDTVLLDQFAYMMLQHCAIKISENNNALT
jgi:hypothetical protein